MRLIGSRQKLWSRPLRPLAVEPLRSQATCPSPPTWLGCSPTKTAYGALDILVNNAEVYTFEPIDSITENELHRQFNTSLLGPLMVTPGVVITKTGNAQCDRRMSWPLVELQAMSVTSLPGYQTAVELERGLASDVDFCCYKRLHIALD